MSSSSTSAARGVGTTLPLAWNVAAFPILAPKEKAMGPASGPVTSSAWKVTRDTVKLGSSFLVPSVKERSRSLPSSFFTRYWTGSPADGGALGSLRCKRSR